MKELMCAMQRSKKLFATVVGELQHRKRVLNQMMN
jgi:hypothetical protein